MKSTGIVKALGCVAAVVLALNVYAQGSSASANTGATAAPASKAANRALARKVHHAMARTRGLDPTHIYVKVLGGAVTLTGSAVSQDQIDQAGKAAQSVEGVTSVTNRLTVRAPT
jgi:hyperosmotically inducible protein